MSAATTSWGRMTRASSAPAGRVVSRRPMKFLSADSIAWRTPSSVSTTRHAGRLQPGDGLRDLGLDAEDGPRQLDRGQLLLGSSLPDQADVADSPVLQFPDGSDRDIHAGTVGVEHAVGPAKRSCRPPSSPVAVAGLVTIRLGRRGRFFSRRSSRLAAAISSCREAISGRLFKATGSSSSGERSEENEGHLEERRLDWLEQRGRVKQKHLRQAPTCDPPVADGDLLALPQALQFGLCPIDLKRCDQTGCQPLGEVDEQLGPDDRRPDAEQSSPRRLDVEIGLGHREQDIVPRSLEVGPPRGDNARPQAGRRSRQ